MKLFDATYKKNFLIPKEIYFYNLSLQKLTDKSQLEKPL